MSRIFNVAACVTMLATSCLASDETLVRGVPGTYIRHSLGLYSEEIHLSADSTFVFDFIFDVGSDREKGKWSIHDGTLVLSPNKKGGLNRDMPSHFSIVVFNRDLALREIVEGSSPPNDSDNTRLFIPEPKKANQSTDPTLTSGTPAAVQPARHP